MNTAIAKYNTYQECQDEVDALRRYGVPEELLINIITTVFIKGEKSGIKESEAMATSEFNRRRLKDIYVGECE